MKFLNQHQFQLFNLNQLQLKNQNQSQFTPLLQLLLPSMIQLIIFMMHMIPWFQTWAWMMMKVIKWLFQILSLPKSEETTFLALNQSTPDMPTLKTLMTQTWPSLQTCWEKPQLTICQTMEPLNSDLWCSSEIYHNLSLINT